MPAFDELIDRFLYRPDEVIGPFLELAPETREGVVLAEEVPEEFLAFALGSELYAVPIARVREILKVSHVTEVPRAQRNVIGLINVRGEMLPLYDIKMRLKLADSVPHVRTAADVPRTARIVLVKDEAGDAGVLVDRVHGVVKLSLGRLEAPPALGPERNAIAWLGHRDGQLFILLDLDQAFEEGQRVGKAFEAGKAFE